MSLSSASFMTAQTMTLIPTDRDENSQFQGLKKFIEAAVWTAYGFSWEFSAKSTEMVWHCMKIRWQ
jgi:hypothetical protein